MKTSSEGDRSGVWKDRKRVTFHIAKQQSGAQTRQLQNTASLTHRELTLLEIEDKTTGNNRSGRHYLHVFEPLPLVPSRHAKITCLFKWV